jgi:hypothetical protein
MANDMFLNNHIIQIKKLCILFDNLGALTTVFFFCFLVILLTIYLM